MQPILAAARVYRTSGGRMRLGWRLVLFMGLAMAAGSAAVTVLPPGQVAGSAAILVGSLAGGIAVLALDGRPARALGFRVSRRAIAECASGMALGVVVAGVVVGIMAAGGGLVWIAEPGEPVRWLAGALGALAFLALPAAAEEALLRGYPLQALAEEWGPRWALGITAIAFGALHLGNPGLTVFGLINVTVAGVFLGVVYLKTLSLWWATGAHVGWNWAHGYLADVPVSGLELMDAPFYEGVSRGPVWLGGGSFGPEGSLVAGVVVAAAAVWCWKTHVLSPSPEALSAEPLASPFAPSRGNHS